MHRPVFSRLTAALLAMQSMTAFPYAVDAQQSATTVLSTEEPSVETPVDDSTTQTPAPALDDGASIESEQQNGADIAAPPALSDVTGHWAQQALEQAYLLGLIDSSDGMLYPDAIISYAELSAILVRALGGTKAAPLTPLPTVRPTDWYADAMGKALYLGLFPTGDTRSMEQAATRGQVFVLLCRAFGFDGMPTSASTLAPFSDATSMPLAQQQAAAALIEAGVLQGSRTGLNPDATLTRAEFITMLVRITSAFVYHETDAAPKNNSNALINLPQTDYRKTTLGGDRIFAAGASALTLDDVRSDHRIVLKGMDNMTVSATNSTLHTLSVDPAGTAQVQLDAESLVDTLLVGGIGGEITINGQADTVVITARNRTIRFTGGVPQTVRVLGAGNAIILEQGADTVTVEKDATYNHITSNDTLRTVTVGGRYTTLKGTGRIGLLTLRASDSTVTLPYDSLEDQIDTGLEGVQIKFGVPTRVVPGGSLKTQASFSGVTDTRTVRAEWYRDGVLVPNYVNDAFQLTPTAYSNQFSDFTFTRDMKPDVTMGFKLIYQNPATGETESVYNEVTVPIENYSKEWYDLRDPKSVLARVSSVYRGNYTRAYAVNNDYQPIEKEVWVNAKGYESQSEYLVWINRAYQHVNVFSGSKGNWKLIKSFLVGTGAASSPTPTGVTTVTYRSKAGWTTGSYTVRPVIGFYPGTGYAFHSRLCYPGTDKEYDFSGGYPVSHGCIRMDKSDVNWIYDNIPIGTTVVIH